MILMWSAPWRICSRAALRTSSDAVGDWRDLNCMALQQWQRMPTSVRRAASLWPPVGPIERPAMNRRGPAMMALLDARS